MEILKGKNSLKAVARVVVAGIIGLAGIGAVDSLLGHQPTSMAQIPPPLPICETIATKNAIIKINEPCVEEPTIQISLPHQDTLTTPIFQSNK